MNPHPSSKTILITGAARGIGAGLVSGFASRGWQVAFTYLRSEARAQALCRSIRNQPGSGPVLALHADVRGRQNVAALFDQVNERFGQVDVLVNNAGINRDGPFLEMTGDQWEDVIGTVLTGTFLCSQQFARRYPGSRGHIINIGALTAITGRKNGANYCSARAGVLALTKCLALELAPRICVNCVTPGLIKTEEVLERYPLEDEEKAPAFLSQIPLGHFGAPEDIFRMVYFLVCDSTYITGQNFQVDGGKLMR